MWSERMSRVGGSLVVRSSCMYEAPLIVEHTMALWQKTVQLPDEYKTKMKAIYESNRIHIAIRNYFPDWVESTQWDVVSQVVDMSSNKLTELMQRLDQEMLVKADDFCRREQLLAARQHTMQNYVSDPSRFALNMFNAIQAEFQLVEEAQAHSRQAQSMVQSPMSMHGSEEEKIWIRLDEIRHRTESSNQELLQMKNLQETFVITYQRDMLEIQSQIKKAQQEQNAAKLTEKNQQKANLEKQLKYQAGRLLQLRTQLSLKHKEILQSLELVLAVVLQTLEAWKRKQQLAGNGGPPEGSLDSIQQQCDILADHIWNTRQQVKSVQLLYEQLNIPNSPTDDLVQIQCSVQALLSQLVTSTFVIEKQPPQVLKTQTKFSATVRFLLGYKLGVDKNLPRVKATIINEQQAQNILNGKKNSSSETSGEILNNEQMMEGIANTQILSVTFRNMSLKKIKRAERRGTEFVTEEKFTIMFESDFNVGEDLSFHVRTMSLPVVVIVHGNQEAHAWATILWDNAFAEPDRKSFAVRDKVPWREVAAALNSKFISIGAVPLSDENLKYLAQKALNKQLHSGKVMNYNDCLLSWSEFSKDPLPSHEFTFWDWFYGVWELSKRSLKDLWNAGVIKGFIARSEAERELLVSQPSTFLLRFADGEVGGISVSFHYPTPESPNDTITHLEPFTRSKLMQRSLADSLRDMEYLMFLHPNIMKDDAFGRFYTQANIEQRAKTRSGYTKTDLQVKVPGIHTDIASPFHQPFSPSSSLGVSASPAPSAMLDEHDLISDESLGTALGDLDFSMLMNNEWLRGFGIDDDSYDCYLDDGPPESLIGPSP